MAPHHHLMPRARVTVGRWLGILIIVFLASAALFVIVVTFVICRRKRARRQRERKMIAQQETHALIAQESDATQTSPFITQSYDPHKGRLEEDSRNELGTGRESPIELHGDVAEEARMTPQQLDGHVAPAAVAHDGKPVEMPTPASMR